MSRWIIGVDPSASYATVENTIGWAILRDDVLYEVGELEPDAPFFTRSRLWLRNKFKMIATQDQFAEIIVGVETAYLGANAKVFLGLIQCQSHLCAATLDAAHTFRFVNPFDSFRASTGLTQYPLNKQGSRSGTRKPAIQKALREKYRLPDDTSEHIYDAISIAEAVKQKSTST